MDANPLAGIRPKTMMAQADDSGFVADGCERAHDAIEPAIRAQVEQEYTDRLKAASPFQRYRLRRELNKEIQRRIDAQAPPDALY